jgi:hypothetical protein
VLGTGWQLAPLRARNSQMTALQHHFRFKYYIPMLLLQYKSVEFGEESFHSKPKQVAQHGLGSRLVHPAQQALLF